MMQLEPFSQRASRTVPPTCLVDINFFLACIDVNTNNSQKGSAHVRERDLIIDGACTCSR